MTDENVQRILDLLTTARRERDEARAEVARLKRKADAFDALEQLADKTAVAGNGIALFPFVISATGEERMAIVALGDEDGSNLDDEIAAGMTLLDAIETAMRSES